MRLRKTLLAVCAGWQILAAGILFADDAAPVAAANDSTAVMRVSQQLFDDLLKDEVKDRTPIDRVVSGARSVGVAETSARFHVTLKPDDNTATALVAVTGQSRTSTVARKESVHIHARSHTDFDGHAVVQYDGREFEVAERNVNADSSLCFGPITSTRCGLIGRLIRRVALRRANQNYAQAVRLLRDNTAKRVSGQLDQRLDELESELEQVAPWEQSVNLMFPETQSWDRQFSTTSDFLQAVAGPPGTAAPELPRRGDQPMQAAVELWVPLSADDPRLDQLELLWTEAQRKLDSLAQPGDSVDGGDINTVKAVRVGAWSVLDLHTASTRPAAAAGKQPLPLPSDGRANQ